MSHPIHEGQTALDAASAPAAAEATETPVTFHFDLTQEHSPLTLEANANQLMDTLFADLESVLDRGVLSTEAEPPVAEPPVSAPAVSEAPPISEPLPKLAPRELLPQSWALTETAASPDETVTVPPAPEPPAPPQRTWHRPLLLLMATAVLGTTCVWLLWQYRNYLPGYAGDRADLTTAAAPTESAAPSPDRAFLDYIGRAIDRITRATEAERQQTALANQAAPSPAPAPAVVERVYIPVYPSPAAPAASAPAAPPAPVAPAAPAAPAPSPAAVPNIAAVTSHTLIGVLALGDRSAALFDVDGTPQRIEIGQQIGSSGWTLVSINNQEAIVRRNGEVRSIYVGQKF